MYIDKNDHNRSYFLNLQKDIVWTGNEYRLQKTYEEDEDGNITWKQSKQKSTF